MLYEVITHHKIWSMKTIEEVNQLKKKYDAFLVNLNESKKYYKMQFNDNKSLIAFLEKSFGIEDLKLLREGFFHLYPEEIA